MRLLDPTKSYFRNIMATEALRFIRDKFGTFQSGEKVKHILGTTSFVWFSPKLNLDVSLSAIYS